jgi:hypothetical protein
MEEKLIEFKRFSKDKQEQIRQFVSYAQMCGLSGADIRSIGDKLDREKKAIERRQNMEIVNSFQCLPIGDDRRHERHKTYFQQVLDKRFKLKMAMGAYNFTTDYNGVDIKSLATGVVKRHAINGYTYQLSENLAWERRCRYTVLLDINQGKIKLDF